MLKWVGRILYVIFVFFIISTIEISSGGVAGLMRGEYAGAHVVTALNEDGTYNVHEGLAYFNAAINTYYSNAPIKNKNNQDFYDTTTDMAIPEAYQVKLGMYPFISTVKDSSVDLWFDGFFIVIEDYNQDALYYRVEIVAKNINDAQAEPFTLANQDYLIIYTNPDNFYLNQRPTLTTYIQNSYLYNVDPKKEVTGAYEYDIIAINFYIALPDGPDEDTDNDETFIYRTTDGSSTYNGDPLKTEVNLSLEAASYNISKALAGRTPTDSEVATYSIVTLYHPADFSPYYYWYWIIYSGYVLLIIIIPYFWFFHKKVMAKFRKNKDLKSKDDTAKIKQQPTTPNHKPESQIFSDVEPKSDDK